MGIVIKLLPGGVGAALIIRGVRAKKRCGKWRAKVIGGGGSSCSGVVCRIASEAVVPRV